MSGAAHALIPAAGMGDRAQRGINKVLAPLNGIPVIVHTLRAFEACPAISGITVIARADECQAIEELGRRFGLVSVERVVKGAAVRAESVRRGLAALPEGVEIVAIHDAARPFVTPSTIERSIELAREKGAAAPAIGVVDSVKQTEPDGRIRSTVPRDGLVGVQTPQTFRLELILRAHQAAAESGAEVTDDASAVELLGEPVYLFAGDDHNIKLTTPRDFEVAEALLRGAGAAAPRVGIGYDVHRTTPERPLILGGVCVECEFGLLGHSDADVLTHAIMDAILGAMAAGDIGRHYPDTDPAYEGADSIELLRQVAEMARQGGWSVGNVDAVVLAQRPKLAPYVERMRECLAGALDAEADRVNVKATTTEGLGFEGTGDGIAAQAIVSLVARGEAAP